MWTKCFHGCSQAPPLKDSWHIPWWRFSSSCLSPPAAQNSHVVARVLISILYHRLKATPWALGSSEMKGAWVVEDFMKPNGHTSSGPPYPDFYMWEVNFYLLELLWFRVFFTYSCTESSAIHVTSSHTVRKPHVKRVGIWAIQDGGQPWQLPPIIDSHPPPTINHIYNNSLCLTFLFPCMYHFSFYFLLGPHFMRCFQLYKKMYTGNWSCYQIDKTQVVETLIITLHEVESKGV